MTNSQNSSQNSLQNSVWQITTLEKPQKFTGLGNFGIKEIGTKIPVLTNEKGQILAIPGLIGGEDSKSENNSLELILEVANFEAEMVAKSSFDISYRSDASKIWAGSVSQNLPELFQEKMIKILDLWQKEMEKSEFGALIGELGKSEVLVNKILVKKNENSENSQQNNSEKQVKNDKNPTKNPTLWRIKPIIKWQKNNLNLQNENKKDSKNKIEINQNINQNRPQKSQNKQQLKIDFEYLADGLDWQGVEFWQPKIEEKLNLIGHFDKENGLWRGNLFYGNTVTLQGLLCDLVRLIGFENLKTHNLTIQTGNQSAHQTARKWELVQKVKNLIQSCGFSEVITRPFISTKSAEIVSPNSHIVLNPYNSNLPHLRNSLLPSLLQIASANAKKGWKNLNIFEINQITPKKQTFDYSVQTTQNSEKNSNMQNMLGIISLEDPYLLTTLAHKIAQKLGFDSMSFKKSENNLGQITILTWSKNDKQIGKIQENDSKQNLKQHLESQLENETKIEQNSDKKFDQEIPKKQENKQQNQNLETNLETDLVFKIIQLKNSLKKEFDLSTDKPVWYLETEIGDWKLETLDKYFDELDFPSISRDYSLSISQIGGKNWDKINKIIKEIPADFVVKTWPKEYFVAIVNPISQNLEENSNSSKIWEKSSIQSQNKTETKISFKVKFQSTKETLKSEQIDNWEKEMMAKLIQ